MRSWPGKVVELHRRWRIVRAEIREAKAVQRDQRGADELERAREGIDRFPPNGI
jgi:hypothetical protein